MHTFFLAKSFWNTSLELKGSEFHHLKNVVRLHQGDSVQLLDGEGTIALCVITSIKNNAAQLEVKSKNFTPRPGNSLTLAVGWGKEARRGWLLEKSVELEADGLYFWQAERSQFPVPNDVKDTWTASMIAGAKQCENSWLPELRTIPQGVHGLISLASHFDYCHVLVEDGFGVTTFLEESQLAQKGRTLCVIGPEGGFTQHEIDVLLASKFLPFTMGKRILRWETAALMALGLHWWRRQGQA